VLAGFSSLSSLRLAGCSAGGSESLSALSALSGLRLLDLSQCDYVADDTLAALCAALTQLRTLLLAHTQVRGCACRV
jgi:hypothetical protein